MKAPPADDHADLPAVLRLVPCEEPDYEAESTVADVLAQAAQAKRALCRHRLFDVAVAPSGWLRESWYHTGIPGNPEPHRDAGRFRHRAGAYTLGRLRHALRALPARLVVFGADYWSQACEVQFMFAYDSARDRIIAGTSKFYDPHWRKWLCSVRSLSSHLVRLPTLGRTVLLNCHDLSGVTHRRREPRDDEVQRRIHDMEKLIQTGQLDTLIHTAHTLGRPRTWAPKVTEVLHHAPTIRHAISTGRLNSQESRGASIDDYGHLSRGVSDTLVLMFRTACS